MFDDSRFTHEAHEFLEGSAEHRKIPAYGWDPSELDCVEDRLREALKNGTVTQLLTDLTQERIEVQRSAAILWFLDEMLAARNPRLRAVQIGLAAGFTSVIERTLEQWGETFDCSKQAMQQGVAQIRERLGLRGARNARSEQGCQNMRRSYRRRQSAGSASS